MVLMPTLPKRGINSWKKSYQSPWDEHALDHKNHPDWFRVWALAVARSVANGHAVFPPGEIAKSLGAPGIDGGWLPKAPTGVSQAIRLAKQKGLLDPSSNARCLVLPSHAWQGGLGAVGKTCTVHG